MCVAKGKGFDQILDFWQQRGSLELETLDFGGVHGGGFYGCIPKKRVQFYNLVSDKVIHCLLQFYRVFLR